MIKNIHSKQDLMEAVWEDWDDKKNEDVSQSFIFKYFEKQKNYLAECIGSEESSISEFFSPFFGESEDDKKEWEKKKKKYGKYVLLKLAKAALDDNELQQDEYEKLFEDITQKKYDANLRTDVIFRDLLKGLVEDFFRNHYKAKKKNDKKDISYIDFIDMRDRYVKFLNKPTQGDGGYETDGVSNVTVSTLDEESVKAYENLFKEMKNLDVSTSAFVPLYFDSSCGVGLYIIGRDILFPDEKSPENKVRCCPCLGYFGGDIPNYSYGFKPGEYFIDVAMHYEIYKTVSGAIEVLKDYISDNTVIVEYNHFYDSELKEKVIGLINENKVDERFKPLFLTDEFDEGMTDPEATVIKEYAEDERSAVEKMKE
ncbi:MAG: hypothetical protein K6G42_11635 [Lachnospiraceae bacterium]|nr:hypothetical protein [Lachnospiraceae bacterium]